MNERRLEEIFNKFSNSYENQYLTDDQSENVKKWHERRKCEKGITLSQVDNWMNSADLIPSHFAKNFSGEIFFRFK